MTTKEIWRLVPSLQNVLASSLGRLMVVPHMPAPTKGRRRHYGGEPTFGQWDGVRFIYPYCGKTYKVHRLICEAFHGAPQSGLVCMHLDEDSRNNRPENLAWGTQKENLNAPGFIAYCHGRTGELSPTYKAKARQAADISSQRPIDE